MDTEMLFGGLILIVVGTILMAAAAFFFSRTKRFLATALTASGTVIGLTESRGSEGGTTYQPVVVFTTTQGQMVQFTDRVASNPPGFQPGQVVSVRYDPVKPQDARLAGKRLWFTPMLLGGMGILFLVIGIGLTFFAVRP